jgi:hypothetical protein
MEYKLYPSKIIHWDNTIHLSKDESTRAIIQSSISIDLCKVVNNKLPIIIEGRIKIIEDDILLLNTIIHTKAILRFSIDENPINDLVKMLEECKDQEEAIFYKTTLGIDVLQSIKIPNTAYDPMVKFNKAYQLREYVRKVGLLNT